MNDLWRNEFRAVADHIASKAESSWKHDNKTCNHSALEGRAIAFPFTNSERCIIKDRVFWLLCDNLIKDAITNKDWIDKVLQSLPKIDKDRLPIDDVVGSRLQKAPKDIRENYEGRLCDYSDFLKHRYGYIVEVKENKQNPKFNKLPYDKPSTCVDGIVLNEEIFKIKLFDSIGSQKSDTGVKIWFNSGLFHCLKHFSINGINIAGNQRKGNKRELGSFVNLVKDYIIPGLFFSKHSESEKKKNAVESKIDGPDKKKYKVVFYYEPNNKIFSLDTIIPQ